MGLSQSPLELLCVWHRAAPGLFSQRLPLQFHPWLPKPCHIHPIELCISTKRERWVTVVGVSLRQGTHLLTKQDHRVIQVGRDLRRANILLKAGSTLNPDQVAHGFIQSSLANIQRQRLHNSSGLCNLFYCLIDFIVKKFLLTFSQSLSSFNLCPLPLTLPPCTTVKSLALSCRKGSVCRDLVCRKGGLLLGGGPDTGCYRDFQGSSSPWTYYPLLLICVDALNCKREALSKSRVTTELQEQG